MAKRKLATSRDGSSEQKLQRMSVFGRLPNKNGVIQHFRIGDIIHDVPMPDLKDPNNPPRMVSIFKYSDEYKKLNGPALSISNHNAPPTVKNQKFDFIVLENGNVPSVLANAIPRGKNADVVQAYPGMSSYKSLKNDVHRLNALCNMGGASIGSIDIYGHDSRQSPNTFNMLPLNDRMLDIFTQVDIDSVTKDTVATLQSMGYGRSQLFVNMTGRDTSISVLAADSDQEKVFNVKLPSGKGPVSQVDEAYMSSVLCDAAHSAGISDSYESRVHENKKTGVAAQITEYAYSDMFIDSEGNLKTTNSIPMFNFPLTDLLSQEDRQIPTYAAIADTFDRMMINSSEAKASLARSMLFNHAVHSTGFNIGDIRCVVKSIDPDPETGLHFEMVPLSFGLVPDPNAANSMQISLGNGFYNGQITPQHDGMLPLSDQATCIDIVRVEMGLSEDEARKVYNDVKSGVMSLPDHAAEHGMTKEQFNQIAKAVSLTFGEEFANGLRNDFDVRLELAAEHILEEEHDRDNQASLKMSR
ncbi:hypothetical protein [Reinekea sp. G2M2-21]|uniref:hypothetical protein n=1 Tax=Reinekea sp. G2M2-21 TaxID=2788942 RepID=UPI0018AB747C|nr:hypothetical protein [Reinekea sp. G2M2-21]